MTMSSREALLSLRMCVAAGADKNVILSLSPEQQVSALEAHGFQKQLSIIIIIIGSNNDHNNDYNSNNNDNNNKINNNNNILIIVIIIIIMIYIYIHILIKAHYYLSQQTNRPVISSSTHMTVGSYSLLNNMNKHTNQYISYHHGNELIIHVQIHHHSHLYQGVPARFQDQC